MQSAPIAIQDSPLPRNSDDGLGQAQTGGRGNRQLRTSKMRKARSRDQRVGRREDARCLRPDHSQLDTRGSSHRQARAPGRARPRLAAIGVGPDREYAGAIEHAAQRTNPVHAARAENPENSVNFQSRAPRANRRLVLGGPRLSPWGSATLPSFFPSGRSKERANAISVPAGELRSLGSPNEKRAMAALLQLRGMPLPTARQGRTSRRSARASQGVDHRTRQAHRYLQFRESGCRCAGAGQGVRAGERHANCGPPPARESKQKVKKVRNMHQECHTDPICPDFSGNVSTGLRDVSRGVVFEGSANRLVGRRAAIFVLRPDLSQLPLSGFDSRRILVRQAAAILGCSRAVVLRLLECGLLRAWRLTPRGWWRVFPESIAELARSLAWIERDGDERAGAHL